MEKHTDLMVDGAQDHANRLHELADTLQHHSDSLLKQVSYLREAADRHKEVIQMQVCVAFPPCTPLTTLGQSVNC